MDGQEDDDAADAALEPVDRLVSFDEKARAIDDCGGTGVSEGGSCGGGAVSSTTQPQHQERRRAPARLFLASGCMIYCCNAVDGRMGGASSAIF